MEHEEPSIYTLDLIDVFKRLRTREWLFPLLFVSCSRKLKHIYP